jgi:hypothetical protein
VSRRRSSSGLRIRDLELEGRFVLGGSLEFRDHCLDGADEDVQRLEALGVAVGDDQDSPAGLRHPHHLAQGLRLVGYQHHAVLRAGDVEAVVGQVQVVTVQDPGVGVDALGRRPRPEAFDHRWGPVGGGDSGTESGGGDAPRRTRRT